MPTLSHILIILGGSMIPILELSWSIPFAITVFKLSPWMAFALGVLGNIIPIPLVFFFLPLIEKLLARISWTHRILDWVFRYTRQQLAEKYKKYGALALMLFVAIPLLGGGVWSASIASWLFGIPKRYAYPYIIIGAVISGILVTLATVGLLTFFV